MKYSLGALWLLVATNCETAAFVVRPGSTSAKLMQLRMSSGADNALFGGQGNVEGVPDKPPKAPPVDEDNPHGGEMFRRLIEQAEERKRVGSIPPPQPQNTVPPPPGYTAPPPPAYGQPVAPAAGGMMTPEQQMAAMQQQMQAMMQQMQMMQQGVVPPPPPVQQPAVPNVAAPAAPVDPLAQAPTKFEAPKPMEGVRTEVMKFAPRAPEGRNRDAYEINNSADVYFAQLKRDSNVRNEARRAGDVESANRVFGDEGTRALAGYFSDEVIEARRERTKDMYSTSRDEMVLPLEEDGETDDEKTKKLSYSGNSYRDVFARKKAEKASAAATPPPVVDAAPPTTPVVEDSPTEEPQTVPDPETPKLKSESDAIPMSASEDDSEDIRRSLRTLQGLILKHRGGPGFGAGQLKAPEASKLETSLAEVTTLLRKEAGMSGEYSISKTQRPPTTTKTVDVTISTPLQGAIGCVEAAVKMYQMAATENEQKDLLIPLRDALLSAVSTINKAVDNAEQKSQPPQQIEAPPQTMGFPETYAVTKIEDTATAQSSQEIAVITQTQSEMDPNTRQMQQTYEALKQASGDNKFGLKELNKNEVSIEFVVAYLMEPNFVLLYLLWFEEIY